MVTQIFTFGTGHDHPNQYVEIDGRDKAQCREAMVALYGTVWAFQYDPDDVYEGIDEDVEPASRECKNFIYVKWNLTRLVKITIEEASDNSLLMRISK